MPRSNLLTSKNRAEMVFPLNILPSRALTAWIDVRDASELQFDCEIEKEGKTYSQGGQRAGEFDEDGCGRWVVTVNEDSFHTAILRSRTC